MNRILTGLGQPLYFVAVIDGIHAKAHSPLHRIDSERESCIGLSGLTPWLPQALQCQVKPAPVRVASFVSRQIPPIRLNVLLTLDCLAASFAQVDPMPRPHPRH